MYEYAFRKWPLYTGYHRLATQFGVDVSFYQYNLFFNPLFFVILYLVNFPSQVFFGYSDYAHDLVTRNMSAFVPSYGALYARSCFWFISIVAIFTNTLFVQQNRKAQLHYQKSMRAVILAKLRFDTNYLDLSKALDLKGAAETLRIVPKAFSIEQKINELENEKYDRMTLGGFQQDLQLSGCSRLMQGLGKNRDGVYYEKQLAKLNHKLNKLNYKKNNCAYIVWFDDDEPYCRFLNYVRVRALRINGRRPKIINNIAENNILLANLDYNGLSRALRLSLTVLISLLVSVGLCVFLVYYRDVCRRWRDLSPNWFMQYIYYYSSYLVVIIFDQALRPILRWSATFEKFELLSSQERGFYFKYYLYQLINRFTIFISRSWDNRRPNLPAIVQITKNWRQGPDSIGMDLVNIFLIELFGYNLADLLCSLILKWMKSCNYATEYGKQQYYNGRPIRYASLYTNFSVMQALLVSFGSFQPKIVLIFCCYCAVYSFITRLRLLRLTSPPPVTESLSSYYTTYQYINCVIGLAMLYLSYGWPTMAGTMVFIGECLCFVLLAVVLAPIVRCMAKKHIGKPLEDSLVDDEPLVYEQRSPAERFNIVTERYNKQDRDRLELSIM